MFWKVKPELKGIADSEIPREYSVNSSVIFEKDGIVITEPTDFIRQTYSCSYSDKLFVLIDDIPYNVSKFVYEIDEVRSIHDVVRNGYTFIHINNGEVDVAASREEISNDEANKEKVRIFCQKAMGKFKEIADRELRKDFDTLSGFENTCNLLSNTFTLSSITDLDLTYEKDGLKFQFTYAGRYKCENLFGIRSFVTENQRGRTIIKVNQTEEIKYHEGDGSYAILLEDKEFSQILQKRKAKKLFDQGIKRVYLVEYNESDFDALKEVAGAVCISTIQHDKVGGRSGSLKGKDEIILRYLVSDGTRSYNHKVSSSHNETFKIEDLEDDGTTYFAVPFGASMEPEEKRYNYVVKWVCEKQNNKIVRLSKKDYEKALELDNFFSYEDLIENFSKHFPIKNSEIDDHVLARANINLKKLVKLKDKITCPMVKKLIEMYPEQTVERNHSHRCQRRQYILENFYPHYKVANEKMEKISEREEKIVEHYPLLNAFMRGEEYLSEYVYYINEKSKVVRGLVSESGKLIIKRKNNV